MSPCTLRTSKHGCHDNATATASSGLLIQDPTRNLGLIVCVTFFSFSTAKWTSFAMKFISALSLVLVLFHPEPSGNPGPPTAFPDGHVFYYPVKHYTQVLWYWFIYLCPSHKPSWEMCSCCASGTAHLSALNILQAFVLGRRRGRWLCQSQEHLQIRQQTCPRCMPTVWSLFLKRSGTAGLFWSLHVAGESNIICFSIYLQMDELGKIAHILLPVIVHQFTST